MALAAGGFGRLDSPFHLHSCVHTRLHPEPSAAPLLPYIMLSPSVRPSWMENSPQALKVSTQLSTSLEKKTRGFQRPHHDQRS